MRQSVADAHQLALSKTNSHGRVAVCSCGWVGSVWPARPRHNARGDAVGRDDDTACADAAKEHREHMKRDGPLTATLPVEQFAGTVLNTRRFGHA